MVVVELTEVELGTGARKTSPTEVVELVVVSLEAEVVIALPSMTVETRFVPEAVDT